MKVLIVAMLALTIAIVAAEEKYTTKYDSIDIEEILKSDRLFKNYFNCLMESGKCTPDGRELKRVLPDALKTGCVKCSEKQRAGTERVLKYIIENKPEQWKALQAKYDPDGVYFKKYENEAKQLGVKAFKTMFGRAIIFGLFLMTGLVQSHPTTNSAEATTPRETYDTKFDNIDIDEILGSERLLKNYVNCLAREGPCTPDGKMLQAVTSPFQFFRNSSRRGVNRLREMHTETEDRFGEGDTLSNRQQTTGLGTIRKIIRSARKLSKSLLGTEGRRDKGIREISLTVRQESLL
ncbi:uncharacterized protein LOC129911665 [Episyrphus balteatus]|uniref:uncharacterized protein LOC129911665 n=1 Tax=Episyrphus balteatus TaxID=286459 RepID=UPI0024853FA2|nr:uncharacterized protein LOC129911665 [Episyrphus balteatus]